MTINLNTEALLDFTFEVLRTPSVSHQEAKVAQIIADEMKKLDYDEVHVDDKNSVVGKISGSGEGKSLMFNGHIDHAEVGTMIDPYKPKIIDGQPFGYNGKVIRARGSMDMKSAVAAMVHAAGAIKKQGMPLKGDVWVVANSLEEPARGEGIVNVLEKMKIRTDMAVNGESTNMNIRIGQTGRMDFKITVKGIMCHASFPEKGKNAIYEMNRFLNTFLKTFDTPQSDLFGKLPYAVFGISSSPPPTTPVVPEKCEIILTRRFLPEESKHTIQPEIEEIIHIIQREDPSFEAEVEYLGELPSFYCDPGEKIVHFLQNACKNVMGKEAPIDVWRFGTDAGFIMEYGIPCIGFGPGIPEVAHQPDEFVPVDHLITSAKVYAELIRCINS